jgi:hypothetical protein
MMRSRLLVLSHCLLLSSWTTTRAALQGDEQFAAVPGGRFWAFHAAGLSIVNPETCQVDHEVRADTDDDLLPDRWADGVYMERDTAGGYVLINSGVTTYDKEDHPLGEIIVFSTATKSVVTRVPIEGERHSYSYGVYTRQEYWVQGSGKLFMLPLSQLDAIITNKRDVLVAQSINLQETLLGLQDITNSGAGNNNKGGIHGQVLWDEDPYLARHVYVTSPEPLLYIVNLLDDQNQQQQQQPFVAIFNYSNYLEPGECARGGYYGHGIAYASRIKHLFVQCGWLGPILELDVSSSPNEPSLVAKHNNMSGSMQEYFNGRFVIVTDKEANKVHIIQLASTSGQASRNIESIDVPGHPDKPSFYTTSDDRTIICMPLTENVNRNDRDTNGKVACDEYSCGPPQSPDDVAAGMCLYDTNDNNQTLLRAPLDDFIKVVNGEAPYFNRCPRCKNRDSYHGGDICTCTPHCGSCGTPSYNRNDLAQTGVRCLDLDSRASAQATLISGAGAVLREPPSFWQPQCSYGWTTRPSKRGGRYMASIAHIPANSVQIIDMATQTLRCQVDLPGRPDRVLYVPPPNITSNHDEGEETQWRQGGVMTVVIVVACAAITGIVVSMLHFFRRREAASFESSAESALYKTPNDLELTTPAIDAKGTDSLPAIS